MKNYDLYGFNEGELDTIRESLERAAAIRFAPHDSSFRGGDYYLLENGEERLTLQRNIDLIDNEPVEPGFAGSKALLYVEGTDRPEFFAHLIKEHTHGVLLRSEQL